MKERRGTVIRSRWRNSVWTELWRLPSR